MVQNDLKQKTALLRRNHILEAAVRVFERSGYRGATIKSIAQEAGVSDGTIYNVFENKEALLIGVLESLLRGAQAETPLILDANAKLDLKSVIAARWQKVTPETLSMTRIIWSEALTDRALAKRYFDTILQPALDGMASLVSPSFGKNTENQAQTLLKGRAVMAAFLGFTLLKLLGDPALEQRMDEVPDILAKFLNKTLPDTQNRTDK